VILDKAPMILTSGVLGKRMLGVCSPDFLERDFELHTKWKFRKNILTSLPFTIMTGSKIKFYFS